MKKSSALKLISNSARIYSDRLLNNNYLFITDSNLYLETCFKETNFKHLTGVESKLSPKQFYKNALDSKLTEKDIDYKENGTTQIKLNILESILDIQKVTKMLGIYNKNNLTNVLLSTEKLIGNTNYCMGFKNIDNSLYYVPNTVLKEDIRNITISTSRVLCILKKHQKNKVYEEICYTAKGVNIREIQYIKEIQNKISFLIFEKEETLDDESTILIQK